MKHRSEHQRNIAFDLLRMWDAGVDIADYFEEDEPIAIYGLDFLGKQIFDDIKEKVNVVCFIDRAHDMETFRGIPVYSLDNSKLQDAMNIYNSVKVVVMIMHDWTSIKSDILRTYENAVPVSFYHISSWIKLHRMNTFTNKQSLAKNILEKILNDEETPVDKIVLVGTGYTQLLSMLILPGWENTLYIAERFFPQMVVEKLTQYNIPCIYEEEAGEFYDFCYLIAEYARKRQIPIYGHDHMLLSQAFLENSVHVIEDGDVNYIAKRAKKYVRILDGNQIYYPFGYSELVKEVMLTNLMEIPQEISHKAVFVNPSDLWKGKTEEERQMLSDIFSFPYEEIESLVCAGKSILFLTEPYTRMKGQHSISVEKQISLMKEVLSLYDRKKVMIKPHPSDDVDYERYLPEYSVIGKCFPIQMLKWTGIELEKIVMLGEHTCMYALQDAYEINVHEDIVEQYGIHFS